MASVQSPFDLYRRSTKPCTNFSPHEPPALSVPAYRVALCHFASHIGDWATTNTCRNIPWISRGHRIPRPSMKADISTLHKPDILILQRHTRQHSGGYALNLLRFAAEIRRRTFFYRLAVPIPGHTESSRFREKEPHGSTRLPPNNRYCDCRRID